MIVRKVHCTDIGISGDYFIVVQKKDIRPENEEAYILAQSGSSLFFRVESLPPSKYGFWCLDSGGEIIVDQAREEAKEQEVLIGQIEKRYEEEVADLQREYTKSEVDTFPVQEREARLFLADSNVLTPFLDELSLQRGEEKAVLALKIVEKATAYAVAAGALTGAKQKEIKLIKLIKGEM